MCNVGIVMNWDETGERLGILIQWLNDYELGWNRGMVMFWGVMWEWLRIGMDRGRVMY